MLSIIKLICISEGDEKMSILAEVICRDCRYACIRTIEEPVDNERCFKCKGELEIKLIGFTHEVKK